MEVVINRRGVSFSSSSRSSKPLTDPASERESLVAPAPILAMADTASTAASRKGSTTSAASEFAEQWTVNSGIIATKAPLTIPSKISRSSKLSSTASSKKFSKVTSRSKGTKSVYGGNVNRTHDDSNTGGQTAVISRTKKRQKIGQNLAPGMALDNKDSICGNLLRYTIAGSHPVNMSGTHVPGIRMDGYTEGVYPKGMFGSDVDVSIRQPPPRVASKMSKASPKVVSETASRKSAASKTGSPGEDSGSQTAPAPVASKTSKASNKDVDVTMSMGGVVSEGEEEEVAGEGNINDNRGHVDTIAEGTPIPPGPKRARLDTNKSPGMALDNKDSLCGRMIHYMTGGSHPTNMSGTHVPGIRMDGATEGVFPKGLFKQNPRMVKAFVNCFAGYFNTMGGSIPPCPDCPPKSLNLNENSNKPNPLKKSAYEYPWSIRAGFLPDRIEVFELMDDGTKKVENVKGSSHNENQLPDAKTTTNAKKMKTKGDNVDSTLSSPEGLPPSSDEDEENANNNNATYAINKNVNEANDRVNNENSNESDANTVDQQLASVSNVPSDAKDSLTSQRLDAEDASSSTTTTTTTTTTKTSPERKSLWREMREKKEQQRLVVEENRQRQLQLLQRQLSEDWLSKGDSLWMENGSCNSDIVTPMIGLPQIQRELSLRRSCSNDKTCSSIGSMESDKNDEDEVICRPSIDQGTSQSLPSSGRLREWIPSAASGML